MLYNQNRVGSKELFHSLQLFSLYNPPAGKWVGNLKLSRTYWQRARPRSQTSLVILDVHYDTCYGSLIFQKFYSVLSENEIL